MSLEDAVDGKVGKYSEEIDALSPSEKIMFEDQRIRNLEEGGKNRAKKEKRKGKKNGVNGGGGGGGGSSWKPGGRERGGSINVAL